MKKRCSSWDKQPDDDNNAKTNVYIFEAMYLILITIRLTIFE